MPQSSRALVIVSRMIADGPRLSGEIRQEIEARGINWDVARRAMNRVGIRAVSRRAPDGDPPRSLAKDGTRRGSAVWYRGWDWQLGPCEFPYPLRSGRASSRSHEEEHPEAAAAVRAVLDPDDEPDEEQS